MKQFPGLCRSQKFTQKHICVALIFSMLIFSFSICDTAKAQIFLHGGNQPQNLVGVRDSKGDASNEISKEYGESEDLGSEIVTVANVGIFSAALIDMFHSVGKKNNRLIDVESVQKSLDYYNKAVHQATRIDGLIQKVNQWGPI